MLAVTNDHARLPPLHRGDAYSTAVHRVRGRNIILSARRQRLAHCEDELFFT